MSQTTTLTTDQAMHKEASQVSVLLKQVWNKTHGENGSILDYVQFYSEKCNHTHHTTHTQQFSNSSSCVLALLQLGYGLKYCSTTCCDSNGDTAYLLSNDSLAPTKPYCIACDREKLLVWIKAQIVVPTRLSPVEHHYHHNQSSSSSSSSSKRHHFALPAPVTLTMCSTCGAL